MPKARVVLCSAIQVLLAIVFLSAGVMRFVQRQQPAGHSETLVSQYIGTSRTVQRGFGACEIALGIWILSGYRRGLGIAVALGVLSLFTGVLLNEVTKPDPKPCGCFSFLFAETASTPAVRREIVSSIARNAMLLLAASFALALLPRTARISATKA